MGEFVRVETDEAVATIRLDRPPANALARQVSEELADAARRVAADDAVRAVVVWGGERIFAAGADIKAMVDLGPEDVEPDVSPLGATCLELEKGQKRKPRDGIDPIAQCSGMDEDRGIPREERE